MYNCTCISYVKGAEAVALGFYMMLADTVKLRQKETDQSLNGYLSV